MSSTSPEEVHCYSNYQVKKKSKKKYQNLLGSNKLPSVHIHLVSFININENYACILGRIGPVVLFLSLVFSIKSCPAVSSIGHTCIPAAQLFVLLNIYSLSNSFCIVKGRKFINLKKKSNRICGHT